MPCVTERQGAYRSRYPEPFPFAWTSALAPVWCGDGRSRPACAAPHPSLALTRQRLGVEPDLCIGRYEGTEKFLGRREPASRSLPSSPRRRWNLNTCVVQPRTVCAVIRKSRQNTRLSADNARNAQAEKKAKKSALRSSLSLDKWGPHMGSARELLYTT
jgi:hypothetical protein